MGVHLRSRSGRIRRATALAPVLGRRGHEVRIVKRRGRAGLCSDAEALADGENSSGGRP